MQNEVLVLGDEKGARRQGAAALRELGGDEVSVTDSIQVELFGPNLTVEIGGGQAADPLDLATGIHAKQPTINRKSVAVAVEFSEAAATQLIIVAFYVQVDGVAEFLFAQEQTSTAASTFKDGKFQGNPLDFPTRGATLFEVRRAAPSIGQTTIRAWPF